MIPLLQIFQCIGELDWNRLSSTESSIFKGLSVEKNIMAVLEISIKDKQERKRELELLLGEFSITHLRQASAITLSGGERRRVEIARCLASKPKYILLDEPFAGVDPIAVNEIRKLVSQLKATRSWSINNRPQCKRNFRDCRSCLHIA